MDRPDGLESWSDECKRAFGELKSEWEALSDARRASESADEEARSTEQARAAAVEELREARAESEANREWLDGYRDARRAKKREIDDRKDRRTRELGELARDLNRRSQNGQITEREARAEFDEAEAEHDAEVETLVQEYDDLSDERRRRRARNRELRDELKRLEREAEEARDSVEEARERAEDALDELEVKRSETDIVKDYFALIRRCGPQDPQPGRESIEVPLEESPDEDTGEDDSGEEGADELMPWQEAVRRYLMDLVPWFGHLFPADPPAFVGVGSDAKPASHVTEQQQLQEPRQDTVTGFPIDDQPDGPRWKEGCIEFLWVQGTRPEADPRLTSNPITRTVSRAMTDVNTIWGRCACVRFTARVRVVTPAQLGNLWNRDNGIFVADGRTRSVSKERMRNDYDNIVRGLLENELCTAFLVVDGVAGGAGFASLRGKVGVVTIERVGDQQGYGDTTAHELGHAVANINHIVDEGTDDEREHEHGELMWGEGCADYPDRERRRYDKLTGKDCASMKEALRNTEKPCGEEPL